MGSGTDLSEVRTTFLAPTCPSPTEEIARLLALSFWREGPRCWWAGRSPLPVPATTPSTSAAGRHPGRITNSKDPDIAYLEARRRPARVEERIKEAKECGLTNFPHSSFQANRGRLLAVEMAQVLLAWAGRRWCPGEFLAAAPERSRYQLRHGAGRAGAQRQTDQAGA